MFDSGFAESAILDGEVVGGDKMKGESEVERDYDDSDDETDEYSRDSSSSGSSGVSNDHSDAFRSITRRTRLGEPYCAISRPVPSPSHPSDQISDISPILRNHDKKPSSHSIPIQRIRFPPRQNQSTD